MPPDKQFNKVLFKLLLVLENENTFSETYLIHLVISFKAYCTRTTSTTADYRRSP